MSTLPRFRETFPDWRGGLGFFEPGPLNSITDVPGVEVGHATVRDSARGYHTGVTAIWPGRDIYQARRFASGHVLHGAGEMTGLLQVLEWGVIETPILLGSTLNVGRIHDAVIEWMAERHPQMALNEDVIIPVVAECDDSFLSRSRERPVGPREVRLALESARGGTVEEGSVGAGTGMMAFDFKAGIGTSSRRVRVGSARGGTGFGSDTRASASSSGDREFTLGVLLNANFGMRRQLRMAGQPVGQWYADQLMPKPHRERSVIGVIATDAPLRPDQLRRLCVRAGLGLARVGSFAGHGSGEIFLGFTTAAGEPRGSEAVCLNGEFLNDAYLNPFYEATVECVEEAVLNALVASAHQCPDGAYLGRDGHQVHGLPLEELRRRASLT